MSRNRHLLTTVLARLGRATLVLGVLAVASCVGCKSSSPATDNGNRPSAADTSAAGDAIEKTTTSGPVSAVVRVKPASPTLGDTVELSLVVDADAGVQVTMPSFGEALGRFNIVRFTPREETRPDGGSRLSQRYVLDPPSSGKQRIPQLRIEFVDHRASSGTATSSTATAAANQTDQEPRELLTDEVAIDVQTVLTDSELGSQVSAIKGQIEPPEQLSPALLWVLLGSLAAAALAGLVLLRRWRRKRTERRRVDAYAEARARLSRLEQRGLPATDEADAWYVELSAIVRRYLEDRHNIRAPELTTEEFLREARRAAALSDDHRAMLSDFLAGCDRVKFAGHHPDEDESRAALAAATRFVEETRPRAEDASGDVSTAPAEQAPTGHVPAKQALAAQGQSDQHAPGSADDVPEADTSPTQQQQQQQQQQPRSDSESEETPHSA